MNGRVRLIVCLSGLAQIAWPLSQVQAQFYSPNPCNQCAQPVVQSCYQTVPVTEYRTEKQTVQRPVYETAYEDQQVTEYRPVTEVKTASIPSTTYQDVVECQTVQRDMSRWVTQYQPRPMISPCQYDGRPTITGWMNRTAFSIRNTFTPRYTVSRQYVPNVVAYNVPVTRRIPTTVMREVNYNVTRMVPYTTTRKVAVNKLRYETVQIDVVRPVTVMRTVPTGTTVAYSYSPYGVPTVMSPIPDPNFAQKAIPSRTADNSNGATSAQPFKRSAEADDDQGDAPAENLLNDTRTFSEPIRKETVAPVNANDGQNARRRSSEAVEHDVAFRPSVPSIVRVSGWKARSTQAQMAKSSGPKLASPQIHVVNSR